MAAVRPVINGQMDHHSIRELHATSAGAYYIIPGDGGGVLILRKVQQRALIITRVLCTANLQWSIRRQMSRESDSQHQQQQHHQQIDNQLNLIAGDLSDWWR